jgi:hypothetical protein
LLFPRFAAAQEGNNSPPPLQRPTAVSAHTNGELPFGLAVGPRAQIEKAGDAALFEQLLKDANMPIPNEANFDYEHDCPASVKSQINSRQGELSWADNARPTECGRNCIGPPIMSQTQNMDRSNSIYSLVNGNLTFHFDLPGPINGDVYYGLEVDVHCDVPGGSRTGSVNVTTHLDGPWQMILESSKRP